jgi:hypothetical protein
VSNSRAFAYNPSETAPIGATQYGNLAIQISGWNPTSGGLKWWNGPDEDLGYVIARSIPAGNHPTPEFNQSQNLTLSSTYKGVDINLSNGDQTASQQFGYQMSVLGNTLVDKNDKVMFSILSTSLEPLTLPQSRFIGVGKTSMNYQGSPYGGYPGNDNKSVGFNAIGEYYFNGGVIATGLPTFSSGDIIDIAINLNSGNKIWIRVNGGYWNNSLSENPITGVCSLTMSGLTSFYPVLCPGYEGTMVIQNTASYSVPNGFNFLGTNINASVGFYRTNDFTDQSFLGLIYSKLGQSFPNGLSASNWLRTNGYWTSYITPVLSLDAANWTSGDWVDSVGGKSFTLYNSPSWSSNNGGYFNFDPSFDQYAESSSLPDLSNWTIGVWHYYDSNYPNSGSAPCLVTEVYPGSTGQINYSLGNNNGDLSIGFFDGGAWRVTDGYSLIPPGFGGANWYYIVGTYDGTTINLYVNNTLYDTTNYTGTPISSQGGIRLMRRWDLGDYWSGRLATVDIYDKALNPGQIDSIWNLTKSRFDL